MGLEVNQSHSETGPSKAVWAVLVVIGVLLGVCLLGTGLLIGKIDSLSNYDQILLNQLKKTETEFRIYQSRVDNQSALLIREGLMGVDDAKTGATYFTNPETMNNGRTRMRQDSDLRTAGGNGSPDGG